MFGDEDLRSDNGLYPLHLTASSRTVSRPRKLNLAQKPAEIVIPKPPTPPSESRTARSVKRLSPVVQQEEPLTAKLVEVDRRVMQWRNTSGASPNPLSNKTGQISLDPAHMPNSAPGTPSKQEHVHGAEEDEELNLDDFSWSISSAGPQSYPPSPDWSERQASIHLEWRMRGSAPATPSTASTGWPYDYPDSPVYSLTSRVPSLDIGQRMIESAPCTPTTATSWGAPSYAVSMLGEEDDSQSLDLGHRFSQSRPMTPSTATSWGPGSYVASPTSEYYAESLQLGQRLAESQPVTPTTATSWGPGSYPPSPVMEERVLSPGIADRVFDHAPLATRRARVSGLAFPYYTAATPSPRGWNHVWPYTSAADQEPTSPVWNHVWPYNSPVEQESVSPVWKQVWPYNARKVEETVAEPWSMVWPYRALVRPQPATVRLAGSDAVYPIGSASIYPTVTLASKSLSVRLAPSYPMIDLCTSDFFPPLSISNSFHRPCWLSVELGHDLSLELYQHLRQGAGHRPRLILPILDHLYVDRNQLISCPLNHTTRRRAHVSSLRYLSRTGRMRAHQAAAVASRSGSSVSQPNDLYVTQLSPENAEAD